MKLKFLNNKKRIYLDYASGAPMLPSVLSALKIAEKKYFANPSSIHSDGVLSKKALNTARVEIAKHFDAHADEIVFTSGGTESNALAICGIYWKAIQTPSFFEKKVHIITTTIEHSSILKTCAMLEREGVSVTYLPVGSDGMIDSKSVAEALRPETILVSIAYVNNEIGVISPIKEIAKEIRRYKKNTSSTTYPLFHIDACQAVQYLDIGALRLGVDLMSWNGTKIGGPRGTGALYIKRETPISPLYLGGGQEYGVRAGTENVPGVVGLACALAEVRRISDKENSRVRVLRDVCIAELIKYFPDVRINGSLAERAPNNINISFPHFSSELLVLELNAKGLCVSAGSACSSTTENSSHVISVLYGNEDTATWGTIRVTLGATTTRAHMHILIQTLRTIFEKYKKTGIL